MTLTSLKLPLCGQIRLPTLPRLLKVGLSDGVALPASSERLGAAAICRSTICRAGLDAKEEVVDLNELRPRNDRVSVLDNEFITNH